MLAPDSIVDYVQQYNSYINRRYSLALAYAQECYTNSSATQICSIYKQRRLPINVYRNISCPFPGKEICARNSTNLRLDTGFLDSHDHLGINTKPQNRFVFRHVDECAPLTLDGYLWSNNSHVYTVQNSSTEYRYGELSDNGKVIDPATFRTSPSSEAIYALHNRDADYRLRYVRLSTFAPQLISQVFKRMTRAITVSRVSIRFLSYCKMTHRSTCSFCPLQEFNFWAKLTMIGFLLIVMSKIVRS